ncbi:MAG TPA: FecR domain-containing protein [Thermoanaerobaculia bacterium]|nr:FecR domain-containing protein [Thermoanaerobaculia bacterium]
MSKDSKNPLDLEGLVDVAVEAMRGEEPSAAEVEAASARVWKKVSVEMTAMAAAVEHRAIRSCDDVRALLPLLVAGTLDDGRKLLVEDHTRSCIPCRKQLQAIRAGRPVAPSAETAARARVEAQENRSRLFGWLAAAAVVLALVAGWFTSGIGRSQSELMQVVGVEGQLFAVEGGRLEPLVPGDWIDGTREVRTAGGSHARFELADGSQVEVGERSALQVQRRRRGLQVRVDRGSIIVEASEQGSGSLGVSTREMLVSVKGTIFAVSHGSKGSRVSVIEGEVQVAQGRNRTSLYPGDQLGSRPTLAFASFAEEVGWSENGDRYLQMMEEFSALRRDINQLMSSHELRTSTRLARLVPQGTVVYAALPNPTATLSSLYQLIRERLAASPTLSEWWSELEGDGDLARLDELVASIQELSGMLGEETVVAFAPGPGGFDFDGDDEMGLPMVLSEVEDAAALRVALRDRLAELEAAIGEQIPVILLDGSTTTVPALSEAFYVWVGEDLLAATTELSEIHRLAGGQETGFVDSEFFAQIERAYRQGAGYLGAVDLQTIFAQVLDQEDASERRALELSGFSGVEHLVVERHQHGDRAFTSAELSFEGQRQGMAAWLANPGPMGALEFISPDATFVSSFLTADPVAMIDELFGFVRSEDGDFDAELARIEGELGISLRDDLASPLGGEVAVAIDGPALPVPSWKAVVEVLDPDRFQSTIEILAVRAAEEAEREGGSLTIRPYDANGRLFFEIDADAPDGSAISGVSAHYTYVDGYLILAPSRALVERAIQYRDSGVSILTSEDFRSLLPTDGYVDFSAVVYNRLGEAVSSFLDRLPRPDGLTDEQQARMDALLAEIAEQAGPALYALYGEDERIRLSSNSPSLIPFAGLGTVFGLSSMFGELGDLATAGAPWA